MSLCKSMTLTPSQRLSKAVRDIDAQQALLAGKSVWAPKPALPLQQWTLNLFHTLMQQGAISPQYLLNTVQTKQLWQNITQDTHTAAAIKAWSLCRQWHIDIEDTVFLHTEETEIWQQWARQFQKITKDRGWIDANTAFNQVIDNIADLKNLPETITLLGFTHFNPAEKKFLTALRNRGISITETQLTKTPTLCVQQAFDNEEQEFEALARWAIEKSQQGSVACVMPQLTFQKNKILTVFERYLDDKSVLNISLGNRLSDYALVQAALTGLSLLDNRLSLKTISHFLLSPFYTGGVSALSTRALLEAKLQAMLPPITSQSKLQEILDNHPISHFFKPPINDNILKTYSEWAVFFQAHLSFLGWPGERSLSSEEFQLIQHWDNLIKQFISLSVIIPQKITFHTALKKLNALAGQIIFQAKRSPHAKIDILGILEAAGLVFDYVWLAGLHEEAWPARRVPNPFLPIMLQKNLNMPHASSTQNLIFAENITQQLLSSGHEIVISYPQYAQDYAMRPSVLISAIPAAEIAIPDRLKIAEIQYGNIILESLEDTQAQPLSIHQGSHYGSEIFKDQIACPFRAFAKHRLKAKKIESAQMGIKALTRGSLTHQVLENIFQAIKTHQALCNLDITSLDELIKSSIDKVFSKLDDTIFVRVEKKRLAAVILGWLEQEKKREPFTVIATEESVKTTLGGLPLHLRIDRIDYLADKDKYMIIDYKTGKIPANIEDEPQLPLYCVVSPLPIDSIAFAQLSADEMKLKILPQQKALWEKTLLQLTEDFRQGRADIKPKYGEQTCRYCDLSAICRIKEIS